MSDNMFKVKTYPAIVKDINDYIIAHCDKITDFNEGGGLTSQIEAFAKQMEQLYIRAKVNYEKYFLEIPFYAFNFPRQTGEYAGGEVIFSRTNPATEDITIDTGTEVSTSTGIKYATTEDAVISIGNTESALTTIVAIDIGTTYNVPADSVNTIVSNVPDVDFVNNDNAIVGGLDLESSYDYLKRFQIYINGLGKSNTYGIMAGALSVDGVRSVSVQEHFPPLSGLYNFTLYLDDGAGNASDELVAEVDKVIRGLGTEEYPGYKACGINPRILAPVKVSLNVTLEIEDDGTRTQEVIQYDAEQSITTYINSLGVGEEFVYNKLVEVIMSVSGVFDVTLTTPTENQDSGSNQIIRVGVITTTFA